MDGFVELFFIFRPIILRYNHTGPGTETDIKPDDQIYQCGGGTYRSQSGTSHKPTHDDGVQGIVHLL